MLDTAVCVQAREVLHRNIKEVFDHIHIHRQFARRGRLEWKGNPAKE